MNRIGPLLRLSRPQFLLGGVLFYVLGVAFGGGIGVGVFLLGQVLVTTVQLTAHYVNEYSDREADAGVERRTFFSGGSGVLAGGELDPQAAWTLASVTSVLAVVALVAVSFVAPLSAAVGAAALAVAWSYSLPPARLLATGWGEAVTSVVVVALVPFVGVEMAGGDPTPAFWWTVATLYPVHLAMMLAFELPDLDTDRAAGKRVLAVRLGRRWTERAILGLLFVAWVVLIGGIGSRRLPPEAAWAFAAALFPGMALVAGLRADSPDVVTFSAVGVLVVLTAGLAVTAT